MLTVYILTYRDGIVIFTRNTYITSVVHCMAYVHIIYRERCNALCTVYAMKCTACRAHPSSIAWHVSMTVYSFFYNAL